MNILNRVALIAVVLGISNAAHADSVLAGANLSTASGGSYLCPSISGCQIEVQPFTLNSQVTITDIRAVMAHSDIMNRGSDGGFSIALVDVPIAAYQSFAPNVTIGTGDIPYGPGGDPNNPMEIYQLFDFSGLNITLGPGTYFLEFAGGAVGPSYATTLLTTTTGTLGASLYCDPTVQNCDNYVPGGGANNSWHPLGGELAVTISGNVVTPEPSSWVLLATGIVGAAGMAHHRFNALNNA